MDDRTVLQRIEDLTNEERRLNLRAEEERGLGQDELARLGSLEDLLDQCWDLLRRRRARRQSGLDPDVARPGDATTVGPTRPAGAVPPAAQHA